MSDNVQVQKKSKWPLAIRLAEAYADSLRLRILAQCNLEETSPRRFHAEHGGATLPKIQRGFEVLAQYGWLELTRTEGEGAGAEEVERFYVGTDFPVFEDETFHQLPDATKALVVGRVVEAVHLWTKDALKAGTMTGDRDAHLSCTPMMLDERGWQELMSRIDAVFRWLLGEIGAAKERLAGSGEEPIPVTVGLLAFESPRRPPRSR